MKPKHTSTAHDGAFKGFMTQVDSARDFFEIHLPEHIKSLCDFSTLALTNSSFIDKQLRSRLSDVLYSVHTTQGEGYIYLLVEHQSSPDKLMAWRLIHYAFLAMNQHLQQGHKILPLVVPVLFYHGGRSPYPFSQLWTDCFPLPDIANHLYTRPFPLVDVTVIDDNQLVNHRKVAVMELAMKHKYLRDEFEQVIPLLAHALNQHYNSDNDIVTILNYLFIALDSPNFEHIVEQLSQQADKHQEVIMNIAQRLQDKGRQEGLQQGIAQGIEQGIEQERLRARQCQVELARNLLKSGINLELLIKNTGLTREELISLP
ncbi:Rpn family recombination-promoting nuclease/putative transposase [Moellerella wisconsensis]|uniref:Rpn family recombination-promoting nuclease/putative transposase n=1 Tax=Moellerella wisconsensis TaxID=158849 RepID=UPI001F4DDAF3|nr:Rpn family recombination-promoting nuclease/putative transposase [Moellerella wisconsensis]UNH26600.1 Rpn family recombination-promoting nuclease/putative transposase [Moellerella wisconsensis]